MRKNNKKKLGVIGGMGPKASAYFYNLVVDLTEAKVDQDHIDAIYINHASMPDRTKAILSNQTELLQELLIEDARLLEKWVLLYCYNMQYFPPFGKIFSQVYLYQ